MSYTSGQLKPCQYSLPLRRDTTHYYVSFGALETLIWYSYLVDDIDTMEPPYELYRSAMASCHVQPPDIAAHRDIAFIFWPESTRFLASEMMASWRKRQPVYLGQQQHGIHRIKIAIQQLHPRSSRIMEERDVNTPNIPLSPRMIYSGSTWFSYYDYVVELIYYQVLTYTQPLEIVAVGSGYFEMFVT